MAEIVHPGDLLIVPQGSRPLPETFLNFLWDHEVRAFLVKPEWIGLSGSGETGLGIRGGQGSV